MAARCGGGPHAGDGAPACGGRGEIRRLRLHPPDLLRLRHGDPRGDVGAAGGDDSDPYHHPVRLLYVGEAAALQAAAGLLHGVEPVVHPLCRHHYDPSGADGGLPAPHRPLRGEDPGLLHRRSRAALQSPGVRPSAGGAGQADARDLRVLHGGGLRPDGRPPLQRLCQQVVHRSGGGGHLSAPTHHRLRRAAGVGAADGYLYVPDRGPGMVPPAQRSGHSGGLRP